MPPYAVLGATGNCGTALVQTLLQDQTAKINTYCRNKSKLLRLLPGLESDPRVRIFEGGNTDIPLLASCVRGCRAVFIVVSTNDNIPGCSLSQDTVGAVIAALERLRGESEHGEKTPPQPPPPKLVLLSSCTIDDYLSRHTPWLLRQVLLRSASNVYNDLRQAEKMLRAHEDWLTTIYIKPGALSVDARRGHALSLTDEESPVSYLDLAAGMVEAADDADGRYDLRNVSVVNTDGKARFPSGTPKCILVGLLRHFFPWLHPYLPMNTGPS